MHFYRQYTFGLLCLLLVIFLWVGAGFLTRHLYSDYEFCKPFFITYINTSSFVFFLIPELLRRGLLQHCSNKTISDSHSDATATSRLLILSKELIKMNNFKWTLKHDDQSDASSDTEFQAEPSSLQEFSFFETASLSLQFCFQWFLANYLTNLSLGYTSVSSSTILTATSGPFTLLLSHVTSNKPSRWQYLSVLFSFFGVSIVALEDRDPTNGTLLGDFFALSGALGYAVYATWLPHALSPKKVNMSLFLGLLGLINACCLWPFGYILHLVNIEPLALPSNAMWQLILVNTLFGTFLSEWLWLKAILWTSPITVTLALSCTIPLAMLGDAILQSKTTISAGYLCGACFILLGFFGSQIGDLHLKSKEESVSLHVNPDHLN